MLIFIDFDDGQFPLRHKEDDRNGGLISGQTNTNICVIGIHQELSFFVHFEEKVAGLYKEFFLIVFSDLDIFFIVGDDLTSLEICIIPDVIAEPFEVWLIGWAAFDAGCVLHGDIGEGDILVNEWDFFELSFFIDAEHDFGLHFGEQVDVSLKTHIHIFVFLRWLFEVVHVVLIMVFHFLLPTLIVVLMLVKLWVLLAHLDLASLVRHVSYK